ncbi:MAG: TonB-dependent receptor [Gemmatimonadota bacterium]
MASTASQGHIGAADLRLRPLLREGELLESVPGVIVTQHSGDGKANQLFVRGFNLDHGTDFQTRLEGMPVNMATHAHGQGYTDLNFIIPEFVDFIDYRLGNYHSSIGDFGSAGGAEFQLRRRLDRPFVSVGAGTFGFSRLVAGGSLPIGHGSLLLGGEAKGYDGPWSVDERLRKFSGIARYTAQHGSSRVSLLALAYRNAWDASDQIPERAVSDGALDRFAQVDPTLGGETSRYSISAEWNRIGGASVQTVQLFGIKSALDLYSNFTYFLEDESGGDQFNQREGRVILGGNATHRQHLTTQGVEHTLTLGVQHRTDLVDGLGLYRTRARARTGTIREDDVNENSSGLYLEAESRWRPRFRSVIGVRGDLFSFDVNSRLRANSGQRTAGIVSPKLSLAFVPTQASELYISAGLGFHSNDARGTTITVDPVTGEPAHRVDPLVRSRGGEVGLRISPSSSWRTTVALWALDLDSELLFVGDGGTTEPIDGSRRRGITLANFYRPRPELAVDADVSFAQARLRGVAPGESRIPGALENVVAAGVTWTSRGDRVTGALRLRHFGAYPLIEDNRVRATATTLLNAAAGVRVAGIRVQLSLLNALGSRASDIQYYYASRLAGEPAAGIADIHFHPVEPRQLRLALVRGL